jgi:thiosulfate reductase cytochrome b subunit
VQKLLYAGIILVGDLIVLSGLSIWKPVQLQWSDRAVRRL